jgi:pimeloyl-ACP methyl ester carboxylesterase
MRKNLVSIAMLLACSLLLAACGRQPITPTPTPAATPTGSARTDEYLRISETVWQTYIKERGSKSLVDSNAGQPQPPRIEEISFRSGSFHVVGDLRLPEGTGPFPVVLFVHGSGPVDRISGGNYLPVMERMARAGYATFSWDKPGTGESTGQLDPSRVQRQRAQVVLDAIEVMKARPDIDPRQIGLAGISQAGYVMPRVLSTSKDVAFMICVSCAGHSGVDQSTFQAVAQAICAGAQEEKADQLTVLLAELDTARTYETYDEYVHYRELLDALVGIASYAPRGRGFEVVPQEAWQLNDPELESWWNPIEVIEQTTIPVLAFFGDKDTQIDPIQGAHAYREALERAGNPNSRVELIPGANHGMTLTETGCLDEPGLRNESGGWAIAPGFLDTIEVWLRDLHR